MLRLSNNRPNMAEKEIIKRLRDEVERLIADHSRINAECAELVKERDRLAHEKRRLEERVRDLDTRLKSAELSAVMSGEGGNVERSVQYRRKQPQGHSNR